jgi:hypothetical protein
LREMSTKPRLLVPATALAVALLFAALAVFASEARAGSFDNHPPKKAVLMKGDTAIQKERIGSSSCWNYWSKTAHKWRWYCADRADLYFPKADVVGAGTRLHVRLAKPERPSTVAIYAWPKTTTPGQPPMTGTYPAGQRQKLKHTFRRVERDGETVAWDVFFRVNEPDRHYYLVVQAAWEQVHGTHVSYGDTGYTFYVKTR